MKKKIISIILSISILTTFAFTLNVGIDKSNTQPKNVVSDIYPPVWVPDVAPNSTL